MASILDSEPEAVRGAPADRCKVPQAFWRVLDHLGLRPAVVLRQARLPATLHLSAQALVMTAQLFAIWHAVETLTQDAGFGLKIVAAADAAGQQPAFLAACYAADFRDAVARVDRFKRLGSSEQFHFDERHGEFFIRKEWLHATEPEPAILTDMTFGFLMELGRNRTVSFEAHPQETDIGPAPLNSIKAAV